MSAIQLYYEARELFAQRDYSRASDLLQQSLHKEEHFKSRELLGQCYEQHGDRPRAIDQYRRALELNPRSNKTAHLLASVLLEQGDLDGAKATVVLLLDRSPTYGPGCRLMHEIETRARKSLGK